jgi:hypothetical protein
MNHTAYTISVYPKKMKGKNQRKKREKTKYFYLGEGRRMPKSRINILIAGRMGLVFACFD